MGNFLVEGEIIKILTKKSKYGDIYYDVHFRLQESGSFVRSCVYTRCRNYRNWIGLLKVGNILENLQLFETKFHKLFVDADSFPLLVRKGNPEIKENLKPIKKSKSHQNSLFESRLSE